MIINSPDGNQLFKTIDELKSEIELLDEPKGITKELNNTIIELRIYIQDLTTTLDDLESYSYSLEAKINDLETRVQGDLDQLKA